MKSIYLSAAGLMYLLAVYFLFFHTSKQEFQLKTQAQKQTPLYPISEKNSIGKTVTLTPGTPPTTKSVVLSGKALEYVQQRLTPGKITGIGYGAYLASGNLKKTTIESVLLKNSLSKSYSNKLSQEIYNIVRGSYFKNAAVFTTATGAVLVIEEFLFPELSFLKRLFIALSFGVFILGLYILGQKKGVFQ